MMNWLREPLLGFSVKSVDEAMRMIRLGVNLLELKLERFTKSGFSLYDYSYPVFTSNWENVKKFRKLVGDTVIQFHLPTETTVNIEKETGFNMAFPEFHDLYIDRAIMLEEIYRRYGLGTVHTMHPAQISENGKEFITRKKAIAGSRILLERWDEVRIAGRHQTAIALENMTDAKIKAGYLGYLPRHFARMIRNTRTFGFTIDVGHRRLAKRFHVRDFMALGVPILNFHFHGNTGEFNRNNWDDDQHLLPNRDNVIGYDAYLRNFRRHRTPVILEISHLENYSDAELREFIINFMKELE